MTAKLKFGVAATVAGLVLVLSACSSESSVDPETDAGAGGLTIVATTTILGDIARNIVGEDGSVEVLMPIATDPHDYRLSSAQVGALHKADLVIYNGLGLEVGMLDVLATALVDGANIVELAPFVDPVGFSDRQPCDVADGPDEHEGEHGDAHEDHGLCDPHVWLDPARGAQVALAISAELALIDSSVDWQTRAEEYAAQMEKVDQEIVEILSALPVGNRLLVTNHDSLGYFADRYGLDVVGTVIPGGSTRGAPSSADLAELVAIINDTGVRAIFTETTEPAVLADAIASEVGHDVKVILLYTGSLGGPDSGAETLVEMLLTNAQRIADGLS